MEKYPNGKPTDPDDDPYTPGHQGHPGSYWGWGNFDYRIGEELGAWRIKLADISFENGEPEISNIRHMDPPEGFTVIEGAGFTPNDDGFIYSYANLAENGGMGLWGDIYISDLNGVLLERLTETPFKHDESPEFSPDGKKILWSHVAGNPGDGEELWIMDADGANKKRLTYFTDPDHDEYDPIARQITEITWSPDGKRVVFGHVSAEERGSPHLPSTLYLLTLEKSSECLMGTNLSPGIIQDSTSNYTLDYMEVLLSDEDIRGLYDWSNDGQWISYMRMGADGLFDAYRIHPDGTDDECLTCGHPGLPDEVHKGAGDFDPSGRWRLFPVEKDDHWLPWFHGACIPGAGRYNDLWVMDMENQIQNPGYYDVYRIREVKPDRSPPGGSLHPHFSNDGTKILWTDLQNTGDYYGDWQIAVADFKTDPWPPHLENMTFYEPAEVDYWYETHGWGPDDSWIYFTCTDVPGMDTNAMDIGRMDFSNPNDVTRLTFTSGINGEPEAWDEHAHLSPLGDVFEWASSHPYGVQHNEDYGDWLKLDQWMMNTNGTGHTRRTYFNELGHEHYTGEHTISGGGCWNPAAGGTEIAITRSLIGSEIREIVILHYNIGSKNNGTSNYHRINLSLLPTGDGGHGGRPDWSHDGKMMF